MSTSKESPQLENGYTRLANELLDAMLEAGLTGRQWAVFMAIVRKTYGFNKKSDDIGLSQLSDMTGIAKAHVSVVVRELSDRKIITRRQGSYGHVLAINKDFSLWCALPPTAMTTKVVTVTDLVTGTESVTVTESVKRGSRISNQRVTKSVTPPVTESVTTKDNPSKDNQKTLPKDSAQMIAFDKFYSAYPKKKSKNDALKAFTKINPDEQLLNAILGGIERAMKSGSWDDTQFIPYPASWLNDGGWMDEVQTEFSEEQCALIDCFNEVLGEQIGYVDKSIYIESRASCINIFFTLSDKPGLAKKFFPWVAANVDLPPHVGFDWLISREGFAKVKSGQHSKDQS